MLYNRRVVRIQHYMYQFVQDPFVLYNNMHSMWWFIILFSSLNMGTLLYKQWLFVIPHNHVFSSFSWIARDDPHTRFKTDITNNKDGYTWLYRQGKSHSSSYYSRSIKDWILIFDALWIVGKPWHKSNFQKQSSSTIELHRWYWTKTLWEG